MQSNQTNGCYKDLASFKQMSRHLLRVLMMGVWVVSSAQSRWSRGGRKAGAEHSYVHPQSIKRRYTG